MRALLVLLAILALAPTAEAVISVQPTRVDFGERRLGDSMSQSLVVENKGATSTDVAVSVVAFEGDVVTVTPDRFSLGPGAKQTVTARMEIPRNASGGRHDPRVQFVEHAPGSGGTTVGQAGVTVPLIVWIENLKIGNFQVRSANAGETATATVLVQNFLTTVVPVDVKIRIFNAAGVEVASGASTTEPVARNASHPAVVNLPTSSLPAGTYSVRAEAAHDRFTSNAWVARLFLGDVRLAVGMPSASVGVEVATVAVRVENPGNVAIGGAVSMRFLNATGADGGGTGATVPILAPGAGETLTGVAELKPGTYTLVATVTWEGGSAKSDGVPVVIPGPEPEPGLVKTWLKIFGVPSPGLLLVVAAGLLAALASRK